MPQGSTQREESRMDLRRTSMGLGLGCFAVMMGQGASAQPGIDRLAVEWKGAIAQNPAQPLSEGTLPETKPMTVMVEGEPQAVTMQLYERPEIPLVTYYPPAMTTTEACDGDGCFVSFSYDELGAAVFFLIPGEAEFASQAEPYITGEEGLLVGSGWSITGEHTHENALRYPWAKKMITFRADDMSAIGAAILGELNGQAFAAVEVFPPDAGDGFAPQAHAILSEVRMR